VEVAVAVLALLRAALPDCPAKHVVVGAIGALATREDQAAGILGAVLGQDRQPPIERASCASEERYGPRLAALGGLALRKLACWRTAVADDDVRLTVVQVYVVEAERNLLAAA
jgi:hypothetical protein